MTNGSVRASDFEKKLAPTSMSLALVRAGALLTGYELVKTQLVDRLKGFYVTGVGGTEEIERYRSDVRSLGKSDVDAALAWYLKDGALEPAHVETMNLVRDHRNEVAHELARFLVDPNSEVQVVLLLRLHSVMKAVDRFWGSITVATDPAYDEIDVDIEAIQSGAGALFDYVLELAEILEESPHPDHPK